MGVPSPPSTPATLLHAVHFWAFLPARPRRIVFSSPKPPPTFPTILPSYYCALYCFVPQVIPLPSFPIIVVNSSILFPHLEMRWLLPVVDSWTRAGRAGREGLFSTSPPCFHGSGAGGGGRGVRTSGFSDRQAGRPAIPTPAGAAWRPVSLPTTHPSSPSIPFWLGGSEFLCCLGRGVSPVPMGGRQACAQHLCISLSFHVRQEAGTPALYYYYHTHTTLGRTTLPLPAWVLPLHTLQSAPSCPTACPTTTIPPLHFVLTPTFPTYLSSAWDNTGSSNRLETYMGLGGSTPCPCTHTLFPIHSPHPYLPPHTHTVLPHPCPHSIYPTILPLVYLPFPHT